MNKDNMQRPLRILHMLGWISSGGVEHRRLTLARGLPRGRYQHVAICQASGGVLPDQLRNEGWQIHEIGNAPHILSPAWHRRAWAIAREFRPDIIHGAVFEGVALANSTGWRLPRVPVISEETSDPVDRSWRGNLLMRAMCLCSDVVIGVSPRVGDYLRGTARIPARKVRVIDNAVLPAPEVPAEELARMRTDLGLRPEVPVIGSVGRVLDSHKRFSDVIRALSLLRERRRAAQLLIIGDGPDLTMLKALAAELGVADAVIFAGYQGEARRFYPLMDVFALASAHEAFGLVLAEAMLAGVPVVATQVGGIPYVLDEGAAGVLVPPLAPEALAGALQNLLDNPDRRRELGEAGRRRAESAFSADRYCREIDKLYQSLAHR